MTSLPPLPVKVSLPEPPISQLLPPKGLAVSAASRASEPMKVSPLLVPMAPSIWNQAGNGVFCVDGHQRVMLGCEVDRRARRAAGPVAEIDQVEAHFTGKAIVADDFVGTADGAGGLRRGPWTKNVVALAALHQILVLATDEVVVAFLGEDQVAGSAGVDVVVAVATMREGVGVAHFGVGEAVAVDDVVALAAGQLVDAFAADDADRCRSRRRVGRSHRLPSRSRARR